MYYNVSFYEFRPCRRRTPFPFPTVRIVRTQKRRQSSAYTYVRATAAWSFQTWGAWKVLKKMECLGNVLDISKFLFVSLSKGPSEFKLKFKILPMYDLS